jgi:hypothetical protein
MLILPTGRAKILLGRDAIFALQPFLSENSEKQRETANNSGLFRCYFGGRSSENPAFPRRTRGR